MSHLAHGLFQMFLFVATHDLFESDRSQFRFVSIGHSDHNKLFRQIRFCLQLIINLTQNIPIELYVCKNDFS